MMYDVLYFPLFPVSGSGHEKHQRFRRFVHLANSTDHETLRISMEFAVT